MKKALLLSAALLLANIATSIAQTTNIYITLQPGYNLITCPLQNADPTSSVNTVLTNINPVPQNCFISFWNATHQVWDDAILSGGDGFWYDQAFFGRETNTVPPGLGIMYYNGDGVTQVATITGTVLTGTNSITITPGFNFYGQIEPIVGDICTNGFPVTTYSTMQTWNPYGNSNPIGYSDAIIGVSAADNGTQYPAFYDQSYSHVVVFAPGVGQGFLYYNPSSTNQTWAQTFSVN